MQNALSARDRASSEARAGDQLPAAHATPTGGFRPRNLHGGAGRRYSPNVKPHATDDRTAWQLHADGAARGNPGPAAAGYVLDDPEGRPREAHGIVLGVATNNVAEYRALIVGLARALELGAETIDVRMDSELVVRQMLGVYRVKNEGLKPLYAEAQSLARRFRKFSIAHVRRELNERADREANRALDDAIE
ncbi:MAG: ribonuclease HI family protein [Candidatus Eiseniibacteriota bacterium]